jgi:hypothetical protein
MNLSIYLSGYLGSQLKDTPHSGNSALFRFGKVDFLSKTTDELLLSVLGLRAQGSLPLAALLQQGELLFDHKLKSFSLLAQPVYLQLQRDSFGLYEVPKLSGTEYEKLTAEFNEHFNEDGIRFIKSQTQQYWFVSYASPMSVSTYPLPAAIHQNINTLQPYGSDAKQLLNVINQVQMLLHEHPINMARSERDEVAINSVWLSGEGMLPLDIVTSAEFLGEGSLLNGILKLVNKTAHSNLEALLSTQVVQAVAIYEDICQIQWDKLYSAVKSRKIKHLEMYLPIGNATLYLSMKPWDCWKFWRKPKTLHALVKLAQQKLK